MDIDKKLQDLGQRLQYIRDIFGEKASENVRILESKLEDFTSREREMSSSERARNLTSLEDVFNFLEKKLESELTPMDRVRIVRHPQRICLKDILENVYDNYTEIGGQDECSIDPSMIIARAYITRRSGKKVYHQPVMVIGQEKGHGQEFRNGGSVKPWGNAKAIEYMKVAETENIPIHTYVFTPGSYPVEDYPGAAQQIAHNLLSMAGLRVPIISVFSEGGSGGAEAIGLADTRMMLSHGYYSVISPEGAAAIEGRLRDGKRATPELIEQCATQLKMTAGDNEKFGYVDRIIHEPSLGARPYHYDFFKLLRQEVIRATDEIVLNVKGIKLFRAMAIKGRKSRRVADTDLESIHVRWSLGQSARSRLVQRRYQKFSRLSRWAHIDSRPLMSKVWSSGYETCTSMYASFKYGFWSKQKKKLSGAMEEVRAETQVLTNRMLKPLRKLRDKAETAQELDPAKEQMLTQLSEWEGENGQGGWNYVSPRAREDRTLTCPNAASHGCLDLWARDLYGDFAGVCSHCGHHFPMEYEWYLHNLFDQGSVFEFNAEIEAGNPLEFPGLDVKLEQAKKKSGRRSGCLTFEARIDGVKIVCAMLIGSFRGGTVGAAEGEKFFRAVERARKKRLPFLSYVHGTAGIRIQEGTNGVIQMPRCTMAIRKYIDAGGLYLVVYDTNSYAGPVASFLGCSPYQFAIRSANVGFAGPGVIKETTGLDIPPDYHSAYRALSRGHIQGIWDRREARKNLHQALLTMGGRNLYYR